MEGERKLTVNLDVFTTLGVFGDGKELRKIDSSPARRAGDRASTSELVDSIQSGLRATPRCRLEKRLASRRTGSCMLKLRFLI